MFFVAELDGSSGLSDVHFAAFRTKTPGKYPKENILHKEHGESLKSSIGLP
jgi:hypothetical protein